MGSLPRAVQQRPSVLVMPANENSGFSENTSSKVCSTP
jgi:hypothetical protein